MTYSGKKYRFHIPLGQSGNSVMLLVAINLLVFIIFAFVKVIYFFSFPDKNTALILYHERVLKWFTLPAAGNELWTRPWTFLTHMFLHDNVWHVFANMLWLGLFGSILQGLAGNKKPAPVFIYGGFAGAVAFVLGYNFLPGLQGGLTNTSLLGASAGIMSIAVVTTLIAPGYRIFPMLRGGIPLWIITVIFLVFDLATLPVNNPGGHIAHLGGAFIGLLYLYFLRRGYDWGRWMNNFFEWISNLFNPDRPRKGKDIKDELFYKSSTRPFTKRSNITQQHIDEILDKINQKGYNFLSEEEKEILKRASKSE